MTITIKIENCESINEIYSHLNEIKKEIKAEAKKQKINGFDEFEMKEHIQDANCYGEHYVTIKPE